MAKKNRLITIVSFLFAYAATNVKFSFVEGKQGVLGFVRVYQSGKVTVGFR